MTQETRVALRDSINKTMATWMEQQSETGHWIEGWVGDNAAALMADAALAVLLALDDVHAYMQRENLLNVTWTVRNERK